MDTGRLKDRGLWYDDVAENLDTFTRLSKAGHFERADHFYRRTLRRYNDDFPVAAQYADSLIDQGAFSEAEDFLVEYLSRGIASGTEAGTTTEVLTIIRLLLANAQLYTKFELGRAAEIAMGAIKEVGILFIMEAMSQIKVN
jgi:hypothetical protein